MDRHTLIDSLLRIADHLDRGERLAGQSGNVQQSCSCAGQVAAALRVEALRLDSHPPRRRTNHAKISTEREDRSP